MTLTVRLPDRVEQELAEYCVRNRVTKSEAVKRALMDMLTVDAGKPSAYDLGKDLFGADSDSGPVVDIARHTKRLLREHFRGKKSGGRKK